MSQEKIATRYAAALMNLVQGQAGAADSVAAKLQEIGVLFEDKGLRKIIASPIVSTDLLREVFSYATKDLEAHSVLKKFLEVLIQARRTALLPSIAKAFHRKLQQQRGIVDAVVTTALPLKEDELKDIEARLEAMLGKKVQLETRVDKSILGGFVVRVENSLLDMSLKTKLENMTQVAVS